jgi:hypothetical protein
MYVVPKLQLLKCSAVISTKLASVAVLEINTELINFRNQLYFLINNLEQYYSYYSNLNTF